jgi:hypothetical protein
MTTVDNCGDRPATNSLSHGTAFHIHLLQVHSVQQKSSRRNELFSLVRSDIGTVAGISPQTPGFALRSVHVGFVVDEVAR